MYVKKHWPPYVLLGDLSFAEKAVCKAVLKETLYREAVPATIITDRSSRIVHATRGAPTISEVRKLLAQPG